jgi:hypothetical protein
LQSNIPRPRNVRFGSKADINAVLIDVCFTPQERTLPERVGMSALCQKQTFCAAVKNVVIRSLVGTLAAPLFEFLPVTDQRLIVKLECRRLHLS